ncbi:hypothetical protein Trydic_g11266 [Trypoxylus dichotomus]
MADVDVCIKQRSMTEFLISGGETPIYIHERLKNMYGDATVDDSTVRRLVRCCNEVEGQTPLVDNQRSGAVTPRNIQAWHHQISISSGR